MGFYDRAAKWLIGHYTESLLWLAGERRVIVSCQPVQAEVVLPTKLPDGLLHVQPAGSRERELHLLEVFVYPDRRALNQIVRDLELVDADRGEVPEISVLTLSPLGRYRIPDHVTRTSRRGTTSIHLQWTCRELWRIPVADLFARNDPGLIPWAPLCRTRRRPESLLKECRRRIEQTARPEDQEGLLATTFVYASLRYDDENVLQVLGDRKMFAEIPLIQEFINEGKIEGKTEDILAVIESRFGSAPEALASKLESIKDVDRLSHLHRFCLTCRTIKSIERELDM